MAVQEAAGRLVGVAFVLTLAACSGDGYEGSIDAEVPDAALVEGKCGLEGKMVECNADLDCSNKELGPTCLANGTCSRMEEWPCAGLFPGNPCGEASLCGDHYNCTNPCWTHSDCSPYGRCYCFNLYDAFDTPSVPGWCRYPQCQLDGTCEMDHEPVEGTNVCRPLSLEGDCRRNTMSDCPEGYEPVGLRGCESVDATP